MTSRDFCYWLQGFLEVSGQPVITKEQTRIIRNHLNMVFKHEIDPSIDKGDPETASALQQLHDNQLPYHMTHANEEGMRC